MGDIRYRTNQHLKNTRSYCLRKMNEYEMRARAASDELQRRIEGGVVFSCSECHGKGLYSYNEEQFQCVECEGRGVTTDG